jgi:4-amino-4-deoxy-L-arabinose transferase-like glycosyltransferase
MTTSRGSAARLAAVLVVALALRLAFACYWQWVHLPAAAPFAFPDSESYWELGQSIAAGGPYQFRTPDRRVFRAPGYPLLLAGLFTLVGDDPSPLWARGLGALVGTLTVGIVYWLAQHLFDTFTAVVAAALVAVYPGAIVTSGLILAEALFCLWMIAQLSLWQAAWSRSRPRITPAALGWAIGAGIAAGIATLTRPSWLLFSPAAIVGGIVIGPQRKTQLVLGIAILVGLVGTMAPWWIRNWHVIGRSVPTTLQVGASLYDGLRPDADGSSDMRFVSRFEEALRTSDAQLGTAGLAPFEYRLDQAMRSAAIDWAVQHPAQVVQLAFVKLSRLWNIWPNEPSLRQPIVRLAIAATYTPLVLLAFYGVSKLRRRPLTALVLLSPAVYFSLLHMIFVGSLRYRQPAILTLAVLAAVGICGLWKGRSSQAASHRDKLRGNGAGESEPPRRFECRLARKH